MQNLLTKRSHFQSKDHKAKDPFVLNDELHLRHSSKKFHVEESESLHREHPDNISKLSTLSHVSESSTLRSTSITKQKSTLYASKWDWEVCSEDIVRDLYKVQDTKLRPSTLHIPDEVVGKNGFRIDVNKEFLYNESYGWHWHKSWTIPTITIKNDVLDDEFDLNLKFQVQLKALKFLHEKRGSSKIHEILLKGETTKDFILKRASFTKVKFSTTSFKNDGAKFHLVLEVTAFDPTTNQRSKSLCAWISPPLFIDSSSETKKSTRTRKTHGYFTPFEPKVMQKKFVKKEPDQNHNGLKIKIKNDFQGLYNYLSAVNIKQKIKHPIFLYFQFSKCFKLYFNSRIFIGDDENLEKNVLISFQNILTEIEATTKPRKASSILETPENNEGRQFIFYIDVPNDVNSMQSSRMILDYLESLRHEALGFCFDNKMVPTYFQEPNYKKVYQVYTQVYQELLKMPPMQESCSADSDDFSNVSSSEESIKVKSKKQKSSPMPFTTKRASDSRIHSSNAIIKSEESNLRGLQSFDQPEIYHSDQFTSEPIPNSSNISIPISRNSSNNNPNVSIVNNSNPSISNSNARPQASTVNLLLETLNSKLSQAGLSSNQGSDSRNQANSQPTQNKYSTPHRNLPSTNAQGSGLNTQQHRVNLPQAKSQSSMSNLPSTVSSLPTSLSNLASSISNLPSSIQNLPSSIPNLPSSIPNLPSSVHNLPSQSNNLPSQSTNLPSQSSNLPSQSNLLPSQSNLPSSQTNLLSSQTNSGQSSLNNLVSQSSWTGPEILGYFLSNSSFLQSAHNSSSLNHYLRNLYIDLYKKILNEVEMIQLIEQILTLSRAA